MTRFQLDDINSSLDRSIEGNPLDPFDVVESFVPCRDPSYVIIELAKELGIELDEAELIRTNSTGLTLYNPTNLANLIKGMKNKEQTREEKIKARMEYQKQATN